MRILGILNITEDSFSDGGKYLAPTDAIAQGARLLAAGADIVDIGAASSHPDAAPVPPEMEIARLGAVVPALKASGSAISIDSFAPSVQRWALGQAVDYLNDIHGFAEPALYPALAASRVKLIVMHAVQAQGVATRAAVPAAAIFDRVTDFFTRRLAALAAAGIARDRLILDPGMGFFVGSDPSNSLTLLARLGAMKKAFGLPVLVSVSRKSFLRALTGRAAADAGAASLAAEIFAAAHGADYIRTHAPGPLRDGLTVWKALGGAGARGRE